MKTMQGIYGGRWKRRKIGGRSFTIWARETDQGIVYAGWIEENSQRAPIRVNDSLQRRKFFREARYKIAASIDPNISLVSNTLRRTKK